MGLFVRNAFLFTMLWNFRFFQNWAKNDFFSSRNFSKYQYPTKIWEENWRSRFAGITLGLLGVPMSIYRPRALLSFFLNFTNRSVNRIVILKKRAQFWKNRKFHNMVNKNAFLTNKPIFLTRRNISDRFKKSVLKNLF